MMIPKFKFLLILAVTIMASYLGYELVAAQSVLNWQPKSLLILNSDGTPKASLINLLAKFDIKHDGTLADIVQQTQQSWLRKPGQERWDLSSEQVSTADQQLFAACGCLGLVAPQIKEYDYVLVMGALTSRMKTRLAYVMQLWQEGIRFKQLVLLTGQRPRNLQLETAADIFDPNYAANLIDSDSLPQTESEIMRALYEQINLPADFKEQVQTLFIASPMKQNAQGQMVRPTTGDTVADWLNQKPQPGKCLVISNNPYIGYQDAVVRYYLPKEFKIETTGPADTNNFSLAVYLDNMARWLYQELQNRKLV